MKILFLTTVIPSLKKTGGEIASQSFIDVLEQNGHQVLVVGYHRRGDVVIQKTNEISVGARYIETNKSRLSPLLWMGSSFLKNLPYTATKYYSKKYLNIVNQLLEKYKYEIIIIDHAQIGWLLNFLTRNQISKKIKIIFIAHNIEHEVYLAQSRNAKSNIFKYVYSHEAHHIKAIEDKLASIAHQVWTLTEHDFKYFNRLNQHSIFFDLPPSKTLNHKPCKYQISSKFDIGIIGSWTWKANLLGLKWFFETVYPYLPKHLSIHIAGKGAEWLDGEYANVKYCGFVPDVQAFMAQARVIAIPSIVGGGVQIKTLDAIASGLPIVATPVALRGIFNYPSLIKVAEQPDEFAYSLIDLLDSRFSEETYTKLIDERLQWLQLRQETFFTKLKGAITNL